MTATPFHKPFIAAMIIPTGVGASVGGFGGDATPQMILLASVCDILITHPNVANAALFQKLPDNALYVEGYGLDQFFKGDWGLKPVRQNRIGLVMDSGISSEIRYLHENTLNAVQTVYGLDIAGIEYTREPVEITCTLNESGSATGTISNPDVLLSAAQKLMQQPNPATTIAVCVQMPELSEALEIHYQQHGGVDPVGGIEAIISHYLVSQLKIPCAHSPAFLAEEDPPVYRTRVDPRAASEYIAPTFLPCILTGLSRAPQFLDLANSVLITQKNLITIDQLDALVVPYNAMGSIPVISARNRNIPIIAVKENKTVCNIDPGFFSCLETPEESRFPFLVAESYLEATGLLQAIKLGLAPYALQAFKPKTDDPVVP